ncbi:hypothetical protein PO654_16645 [Phytobacter diazotrophicus]|uniref:hypothetical protein n=1 Tax=Phytobacter diazotrophicus TaxID=395631 RepID=UPI0013EA0B24|nr:hypothetical protein [Phytobacter diazotrophicus]MDU6685344.1 hypothetical protein [Enterobacteriaceae bacterium]QIH65043.1 hypothetical protein CRX67_19235 [Enterobacteriaceae bacterium A-F18]
MSKLTVSDVIDEKLVEALRLVQCMLEDFRAQNYGHAHDWIRHIDSAMSEYTDTHTDDAYSMLHDLLQSGNSAQPVTVPDESWRIEAEKQAEIYGQSFVVFRNGEQPQCADPTKVVISFTDKGLGHNADQDVA